MTATLALSLPDPAATEALGSLLAHRLRPGETLLLEGPVGAGKSHLARAFIRARMGEATEVPSPSFTLVQIYEDPALGHSLWHADLYRLTHPDEVEELGLIAAFDSAICLVEWPDRLGAILPPRWLRLQLLPQGEGRRLQASASHPDLLAALTALDDPPPAAAEVSG